MDERSPPRLSVKQQECLRLVRIGQTSKEIARSLGISAHTVDAYLKASMKVLEATSRREAAQKFEQLQQSTTYQPLVSQPLGVEAAVPLVFVDLANEAKRTEQGNAAIDEVQEDRVDFEASAIRQDTGLPLPFPTSGRKRNDLSILIRIGWIIVIIAMLAIGTGVLLQGLAGFARLLRTIQS